MNRYNDKGEPHGYWELYWYNEHLMYKGNFNNGEYIGHWEWCLIDSELIHKEFYL